MDFIDELKQFATKSRLLQEHIMTEEATKTSLVMPFFALLGYDVFNPYEFIPEYTADVGIKKGEKVDYAIMKDGEPVILIEAKSINEKLQRHDSQLFRYFGTSTAKFGILTNGLIYRFFTDLETPNKMDEQPFLEINILDIKENQVNELKKFHKSNFSVDEIFSIAAELKYVNEFKLKFSTELSSPSDDLVKLFLNAVYSGVKTQTVIEKFRPVLKKSLNQYVNEMMNDKIKTALDGEKYDIEATNEIATLPEEFKKIDKIITTNDELESFFIIKNILKDTIDINDISYKDTESYFAILYKNNTRKWICRIIISKNQLSIILPCAESNTIKHTLTNLYDIENHKETLIQIVNQYIK